MMTRFRWTFTCGDCELNLFAVDDERQTLIDPALQSILETLEPDDLMILVRGSQPQ